MSATRFAKNSKEWQMFVDYWNLCQKYWIVDYDEEYWGNITNDVISFGEKYKDISLAKRLALVLLEDLQEKGQGGN